MSIRTSPVAGAIPYDNTTSGLTATDVQAALDEIESQLGITYYQATQSGNISTSSGTFTTMTSTSVTPAAGTYFVVMTADVTLPADGAGEIRITVGGADAGDSMRQLFIGVSGNATGVIRYSSATSCITTVNGSQAIEAQWRLTIGTNLFADARQVFAVKIA